MSSDKGVNWVSPAFTAVYPHLDRADTRFGDNKFKVKGVFKPSDMAAVVKEVKALAKAAFGADAAKKKLPFKKTEEGDIELQAKSAYKPAIVDSKGTPIKGKLNIGNGSKLRMSVTFKTYEGQGGGVTAYLNSVKVLSLVEYNAGAVFGDDDEGDFVAGSEHQQPPADEPEGLPEQRGGGDEADETFDF